MVSSITGTISRSFDPLASDQALVDTYAGRHLVLAIAPSYVPKSGKTTPGLGRPRSGTASRAKWGLEVSGIAAIDVDNHTAFHLEPVQTPSGLPASTPEDSKVRGAPYLCFLLDYFKSDCP